MADTNIYIARINRNDASVELEGVDKEWVAEQLDKVLPILAAATTKVPSRAEPPAPDFEVEGGADGDDAEESNGGPGKTRKKKTPYRPKRVPALVSKLTESVRGDIAAWIDERRSHFTDAPNQVAIIAAFLKETFDQDVITPDEIYTVYDVMGMAAPSPRSALDNARTRKKYFSSAGAGKFTLSHTGDRFGKHEAKVAAKKN